MLEEKTKSFEEIFNEWYKMYLDEERKFHEEIRKAKEARLFLYKWIFLIIFIIKITIKIKYFNFIIHKFPLEIML
jgi:hypothetical protein